MPCVREETQKDLSPQTDLSELKPQGSSHKINLVSQQMFPAPGVTQEVSPEVSRKSELENIKDIPEKLIKVAALYP